MRLRMDILSVLEQTESRPVVVVGIEELAEGV
jgi:hypothetical protein